MLVPYGTNWITKLGYNLVSSVLPIALIANLALPAATAGYRDDILFSSDKEDGLWLYGMNRYNNKKVNKVTKNNEPNKPEVNVSISHDGNTLAFTRGEKGVYNIITLRYGKEETVVEGSEIIPTSAQSLSQDGKEIAYAFSVGGIPRIYRINSNGSNRREVTNGPDILPAWSPDKTKILFIRMTRDGAYDAGKLHILDIEKKRVTPIIDPDGSDYKSAVWISDSEIIGTELRDNSAGCMTYFDTVKGIKKRITGPGQSGPPHPDGCFAHWFPFPLGRGEFIFSEYIWDKNIFALSTTDGEEIRRLIDYGDNFMPAVASVHWLEKKKEGTDFPTFPQRDKNVYWLGSGRNRRHSIPHYISRPYRIRSL